MIKNRSVSGPDPESPGGGGGGLPLPCARPTRNPPFLRRRHIFGLLFVFRAEITPPPSGHILDPSLQCVSHIYCTRFEPNSQARNPRTPSAIHSNCTFMIVPKPICFVCSSVEQLTGVSRDDSSMGLAIGLMLELHHWSSPASTDPGAGPGWGQGGERAITKGGGHFPGALKT